MERSLRGSDSVSSESSDSVVPHTEDFAATERALFAAIADGNRQDVAALLNADNGDLVMRVLLMSIAPNTDKAFNHDPDILPDANELLGPSVQRLHPIQAACLLGDEEIALDILEYVAKLCELPENAFYKRMFLNQDWGNGNTTLHLASFLGMSDLVKRLIELGASVVRKNERKYSPIDCADDNKTRLLLMTLPEEENRTPQTRNMAKSHSTNSLKLFTSDSSLMKPQRANTLRSASSPMASTTAASKDVSATASNPTLAGEAVSPSSSLNKPRLSPRRSILSTSRSNELLLKQAGERARLATAAAKRRLVNFDGRTLLFSACETGDLSLLTLWLGKADPHISVSTLLESREMQPLHVACIHGHLPLVRCLVEHGADVNCVDWQGWTPLHNAADSGHLDIIKFLCSLPQTKVDAVNGDGESVLDVIDDEDDDEGAALKKEVEAVLRARAAGQLPQELDRRKPETSVSSQPVPSPSLDAPLDSDRRPVRARSSFHSSNASKPRAPLDHGSDARMAEATPSGDEAKEESGKPSGLLIRARAISRGRDNKLFAAAKVSPVETADAGDGEKPSSTSTTPSAIPALGKSRKTVAL
ncbi:hypothetical protein RI367_000658 [Sorochytrium milnesiophthora]